eukprot:g33363.t1
MIQPKPPKIDLERMLVPIRNSGHMGGRFSEKRLLKNPDTGKYFKLSDLFVGQVVTIAAQPLQIVRADERCLQFLEARPKEFPYADPVACSKRLLPLAEHPEMQNADGLSPDRLKEIAFEAGISMVDHEIITLLRSCGVPSESESDQPKVLVLNGYVAIVRHVTMGGKGKKGFKGGWGSTSKGGSGKGLPFSYGPVLEAPALYAKQAMSHVPKACELRGNQEVNLITNHRRLLHFWKTSPYYIHKADKSRKWRLMKSLEAWS